MAISRAIDRLGKHFESPPVDMLRELLAAECHGIEGAQSCEALIDAAADALDLSLRYVSPEHRLDVLQIESFTGQLKPLADEAASLAFTAHSGELIPKALLERSRELDGQLKAFRTQVEAAGEAAARALKGRLVEAQRSLDSILIGPQHMGVRQIADVTAEIQRRLDEHGAS